MSTMARTVAILLMPSALALGCAERPIYYADCPATEPVSEEVVDVSDRFDFEKACWDAAIYAWGNDDAGSETVIEVMAPGLLTDAYKSGASRYSRAFSVPSDEVSILLREGQDIYSQFCTDVYDDGEDTTLTGKFEPISGCILITIEPDRSAFSSSSLEGGGRIEFVHVVLEDALSGERRALPDYTMNVFIEAWSI